MQTIQTSTTKATHATRKAIRKTASAPTNTTAHGRVESKAAEGFNYESILVELRKANPEGHLENILTAAMQEQGAEGDSEQALAFIRRSVMFGVSGWNDRWVRVLAVVEARILAAELNLSLRAGHAAATLH